LYGIPLTVSYPRFRVLATRVSTNYGNFSSNVPQGKENDVEFRRAWGQKILG
jgi:hypothetical protein